MGGFKSHQTLILDRMLNDVFQVFASFDNTTLSPLFVTLSNQTFMAEQKRKRIDCQFG